MSDCLKRFIPDNPNYKLNENMIGIIKSFDWYGDNTEIEVNDIIQFVDSGANFESVACPFCKSDLMDWWGDAMDKAYSEENRFENLNINVPCCDKETTLHNLIYYFPQGFYKTMIEMRVFDDNTVDTEKICGQLFEKTKEKWRVIDVCY